MSKPGLSSICLLLGLDAAGAQRKVVCVFGVYVCRGVCGQGCFSMILPPGHLIQKKMPNPFPESPLAGAEGMVRSSEMERNKKVGSGLVSFPMKQPLPGQGGTGWVLSQ